MKLTAKNIPVETTDPDNSYYGIENATPEVRRNPARFLKSVPYDFDRLDYAAPEVRHNVDFLRELYGKCIGQLAIDGYGSYGWSDVARIWAAFTRNAPEETKILCEDPAFEAERKESYLYSQCPRYPQNIWVRDANFYGYSREQILQELKEDGMMLRHAYDLQNDREAVLIAVAQNGYALEYAPELASDREIVLTAVRQNGLALQFAPDFWNDRDMVMEAVWENARRLLGEPDDYLSVLRCCRDDQELEDDSDFYAIRYACTDLRSDRQFMMPVVKLYPKFFIWASEELKSDPEFVMEVIYSVGAQHIMPRVASCLLLDREFLLEAIRFDPNVLHYLPKLEEDEELVEAARAVEGSRNPVPEKLTDPDQWLSRENLTDAQLADRNFLMNALQFRPYLLDDLPQPLQEDSDLILAAIHGGYSIWNLDWTSDAVRDDPRIVLEAVLENKDFYYLASAKAAADPVVNHFVQVPGVKPEFRHVGLFG